MSVESPRTFDRSESLPREEVMVGAVVVCFCPHLMVLERLLISLDGQVQKIFVVNNTDTPTGGLETFLARFELPLSYIPLGQNKGIAWAQNVGIEQCILGGCSHVLLLDQDSTPLPGMVNKLLAAEGALLRQGKRVAAVGPRYIDEKTSTASRAVRRGYLWVHKFALDDRSSTPVETDNLIASGAIIRIAALQSLGMMRSDLFIEFVDTEWGLRARSMGYKSYCVPDATMRHSTGDAAVIIFGKEIYVHGELRNYYKIRNAMYLLRLPTMGWQWRCYILRWIPYYCVVTTCFSKRRLNNAGLLLKALWDGLFGRLGPARNLGFEQ